VYNSTDPPGGDPLFAAVDGADCVDQPNSHNLLLNHGLIRIMLPIAPKTFSGTTPNYVIKVVSDPTNCQLNNPNVQAACAAQFGSGSQCISVYRRPLPTTNLIFQSNIMWDGREPSPITEGLTASLDQQAIDATTGHAQAIAPPTQAQIDDMVNFELGLFTAQRTDLNAGTLNAGGAGESPESMPTLPFAYGQNQVPGATFSLNVFTFYTAWSTLTGTDPISVARESIARGETLFDTKQFKVGPNPNNVSHCVGCHNDPNIGNNSNNPVLMTHTGTDAPFDPVLNTGSYLPEFSVTCPGKNQQPTFTTDPGLVLISGNCTDVTKIKTPTLHGLLARAPFFRNGSAPDLPALVTFYNNHFNIGLSAQDQTDMVNFMNTL
jgi:cytochrome c553